MSMPASPRIVMLFLTALAVGFTTGCAALHPKTSPQLTADVVPGSTGPTSGPQAMAGSTYTVEIRSAKGNSQAKQQELSGPLHAQEALTGTKADKKYRRFFVALHRPLPDGRIHTMDMAYDRATKRLEPEYDYAILPGDRIVVTEDDTSMIDDVLDALGGTSGIPGLAMKKRETPKYKMVH